jgi:hypothetical protein
VEIGALTQHASTAVRIGTSCRLLVRLRIRPTGPSLTRTRRNGKHENAMSGGLSRASDGSRHVPQIWRTIARFRSET